MPHVTITSGLSAPGVSLGRARSRSGDALRVYEIALPAGDAGELTTRTSDTIGTATMDAAGHGITTGMTVSIFWSGGRRYNVTVGTVAGTSVPFSGGSGDNLPSTSTGLTITEQVDVNVSIDGDEAQAVGIEHYLPDDSDTSKAMLELLDSGASQIAQLDLTPNSPALYDLAGGDANPFTGNPITQARAANGSSTQAAVLKIVSLEDATP